MTLGNMRANYVYTLAVWCADCNVWRENIKRLESIMPLPISIIFCASKLTRRGSFLVPARARPRSHLDAPSPEVGANLCRTFCIFSTPGALGGAAVTILWT
jgi:hypothetical protein